MDISIGDLARLTGLPVKTIRYYSEIGLVPEARRTPAGYRRYDETGLARVELVRTLRELGFDLTTIRGLATRKRGIQEVAGAMRPLSTFISVSSYCVGPCCGPSPAAVPDPRRYNE
jgi:DNA-binding transcriptional MerR regulator